jgi:putative ABC transport system ATP-binding protein
LARFRSEYLGFVFQAFNLIPYLSAYENTVMPLAHLDIRRKQKRAMAVEALRKVGLADRMKHLPSELSGGQQQRVAIARALVNEPLIIIADEPTGNLDQETRSEIMGLFADLNDEGHTIVSVTHDSDTLAFAKRRIAIVDGHLHD